MVRSKSPEAGSQEDKEQGKRKPRSDRGTRRVVITLPDDDGHTAHLIGAGLTEGSIPLGAMVRPSPASVNAAKALTRASERAQTIAEQQWKEKHPEEKSSN